MLSFVVLMFLSNRLTSPAWCDSFKSSLSYLILLMVLKCIAKNNLHKVKHSNIYSFHYIANIDKYQLNKQAAFKNVWQKNTDVMTVHL
jgi:hypothetical protein